MGKASLRCAAVVLALLLEGLLLWPAAYRAEPPYLHRRLVVAQDGAESSPAEEPELAEDAEQAAAPGDSPAPPEEAA